MTKVVARKRRIIAAWISDVVDGVVPVVVVIGRDSVPAAVVRFQRVVGPTLTSICAADGNSLTPEAERPHIRRVGVSDARLDRLRPLRCGGVAKSSRWRKDILNVWIAFDSRHVLPASQRFGYFAAAFH